MNIAHDPAFAAIERHRRALAAFNDAFELASAAKVAADENPALVSALLAAEEAEMAAQKARDDARTAMSVTMPATAKGAAAVITYILDGMDLDDAEDLRDYEKAALRMVATSLARFRE